MAQPDRPSTFAAALKLLDKWRLDKRLDTDPTLAAQSDTMVPSQRAVRRYVDSREPLPAEQPQPRVIEPILEGFNQPHQVAESWPVGSVFLSMVATDPALLLGYGTWARVGEGMALVSLLAGDPDFGAVGAVAAGTKTKAISAHAGTAVANHVDHTHQVTSDVSVANHADHTHQVTSNVSTTPAEVQSGTGAIVVGSGTNNTVTSSGASVTLSHTVTNATVTSGSASATLTHTVTQPSNHTALNVIQPSFVMYVWERTA